MKWRACQSSTRKLNTYKNAVALIGDIKQTGGTCFWGLFNQTVTGVLHSIFSLSIHFSFFFSLLCSSCVWRTSGHFSRCATTSSACATVSCLTLLTSLMYGTSARWVLTNHALLTILQNDLHLNWHCHQLRHRAARRLCSNSSGCSETWCSLCPC